MEVLEEGGVVLIAGDETGSAAGGETIIGFETDIVSCECAGGPALCFSIGALCES